jgi:hypothetical protein
MDHDLLTAGGHSDMNFDAIVTEVADRLRASVLLVDREFALVSYNAQRADVDADRARSILARTCSPEARRWYEAMGIAKSTAPVRTPANPDIGAGERICLPVRYAGVCYGFIFVVGEEFNEQTQESLQSVMSLADKAGALLAHASRSAGQLSVAVADLLEGDGDVLDRAIAEIGQTRHLADGAEFTVCAVDGPDRLFAQRVQLLTKIDGITAMVVPVTATLPALLRAGTGTGAMVGVGGSYRNLRDARRSWQQARLCLSVARYDSAFRPVAQWSEIGIYRLAATPERLREAVTTPAVVALLEHSNADLVATARVYLDVGGDVAAATTALGIHRQTVYHRLRRIEEITGLTMTSGTDRLELHIGLRLTGLLAHMCETNDAGPESAPSR